MEYSFFDFLKLIGSLAFFLYGMKLMSEALQKVAGDKMRTILSAITSNRFNGVLTGIIITAIIQSSSATTVMVVSFVNAGLLTLVQSIGVIMGANIGTTVTAWLISLLGFKVKISVFALPLIGLAVPFIFSKDSKRSSIGQLIVGFAILFMGLAYLKDAVPDIKGNPEILQFISEYSSLGFGSILIFLTTGTILTMVIQSSSAVMALTLVMCFNGWISFEMAAAMVLGENIGTTITANLAAIVVNHTAKRAARAHLFFNVVGVIVVLIFFNPFLQFIDWILIKLGQSSALHSINSSNHVVLTIALSVFHTTFNILNTFIQIWFIPQIEKLVIWLVPAKEDDDEIFKLNYIKTSLLSVDEIGLLQAKKEIGAYIERSHKMFSMIEKIINLKNKKGSVKLFEKLRKQEDISDKIEEEIANFLTKSTTTELSTYTSLDISTMLKLVNRIESFNDACYNTGNFIENSFKKFSEFTPEMVNNLNELLNQTKELVDVLPKTLLSKNDKFDTESARNKRNEIDNYIEKLNHQHLKDIRKGVYKYKIGILYCDIFSEIGIVANHAYHLQKYISELKM